MSFWEGEAVRTFLEAIALVLSGCAAQRSNASIFTRTDGGPVDPAKEQAVLARVRVREQAQLEI